MNKITDIKDFLIIYLWGLINDQVAAPPRGPHTTRHCALYIMWISRFSFSLSRLCPSLIANGYERTYLGYYGAWHLFTQIGLVHLVRSSKWHDVPK